MNANYIAERIRRTRKFKGISQSEMAKKMGISQPQYSKIENKSDTMRLNHLFEIAQVLDVSVDYLTDNGENWQHYVQYASQIEAQYKSHTEWLNKLMNDKEKSFKKSEARKDELYELVSDDLKKSRDELYNLEKEMRSALSQKDTLISDLQKRLRLSINISYRTKNSLNQLLDFFSVNTWIESSFLSQYRDSIDLNALEKIISPFREGIKESIEEVNDTLEELKTLQEK